MKSAISLILVLLLCLSVFALTGCKASNTPDEGASPSGTETAAPTQTAESVTEPSSEEEPTVTEEPAVGPIAGGWTISSEPVEPAIPEEAKAAFDAATADLTGAGYEPLAYLGSQVVAGVNYSFLCRSTLITAEPETKLCIVKVYRDPAGSTSLDTTDIAITDYTEDSDINYPEVGLAGGWTTPEADEAAVLPEEVQAAFDKATEGLTGVGYRPLALLGSQVVSGCNYAILCTATLMNPGYNPALAVLVIYADAAGGAQINSIAGFEMP